MAQRGAPAERRVEVAHDYDWATRTNRDLTNVTREAAALARREAELTSPRHGPPNAAEREELRGIRERLPMLSEQRNALFSDLHEHIDEAIAATTNAAQLAELNEIRARIRELAGAMGITPARVERPGMVRVGEEWLTQEEFNALQEQLQRSLSLEGIAATVRDLEMGVAETRRAPLLTPELSTDTTTVRRWWAKLVRLGDENSENVDRLHSLLDKLADYQQKLATAQEEGNTRRANYYKERIDEVQGQISSLRKKMDENMVEQAQVLINVIYSLPGALEAARAERPGRAREDHIRRLEAIQREWEEIQEKIRRALALETLLSPHSPELASALATAREYSIRPMQDVFAEIMRREEAERRAAAPLAVVPTPAPPVTAAVPVVIPVGTTYFEHVNPRTGRRYRISVEGQDLSRMGIDEVYRLVQDCVRDDALWRKLHVQRLDERGRVDYTYTSRNYIRDNFFREQLGYVPAVPYGVPVLPPVAAPPAVAPAPPAAAPPVAAPAAVLPPREQVAETLYNGLIARRLVSEPEARRLRDYIASGGMSGVGRMFFSDEEVAARVFDLVNTYITHFGLRPLQLAELEDGRWVLQRIPPPPRTDTILETLARENTAFTEDIVAWTVGTYNDNYPEFPVEVEGWFSPAEIFQRGKLIETLSSSALRICRSMQDSTYRVRREGEMRTINGFDFGSDIAFRRIGVELEEPEAAVGQFGNMDIKVLWAWITSFHTGRYGRLYENMYHALDPSNATSDPTYSGNNIGNARLEYYNEHLEEVMASLPRELRASVDFNALIYAAIIRSHYAKVRGEPATPEAAAALDTACFNAGRVIVLGMLQAEIGPPELWARNFTYNGVDYLVATHFITRTPKEEPPVIIDGQRRDNLLVVPTSDPLKVMVVGYVERGRLHLLREGGGDAVGSGVREAEGQAGIPLELSGRTSLVNGITMMWGYASPGYRFGEAPPEEVPPPPRIRFGEPEIRGEKPPEVTGVREVNVEREVASEGYLSGERINEAYFRLAHPMEGRQGEEPREVTMESFLEKPDTRVDVFIARYVPEEGAYYALALPKVIEQNRERFADPDRIAHTAMLRDGRVYMYRNAEGKFVDAVEHAPDAEEVEVGTYTTMPHPTNPEWRVITISESAEYRGMVVAHIPGSELMDRIDTVENSVTVPIEATEPARALARERWRDEMFHISATLAYKKYYVTVMGSDGVEYVLGEEGRGG